MLKPRTRLLNKTSQNEYNLAPTRIVESVFPLLNKVSILIVKVCIVLYVAIVLTMIEKYAQFV